MSAPRQRAWEDLRREARKLEGEVDVKLAAYGKVVNALDGGDRPPSALSHQHRSMPSRPPAQEQVSSTRAAEIEGLIQRLGDVNDEMGAMVGSLGDSCSHLVARHRDILQDYSMEFRRMTSTLGAARDRLELLSGPSGSNSSNSSHLTLQVQGGGAVGHALRERATVQSSASAVDDMISQAQLVSSNLLDQRKVFDSIGDKVMTMGAKFPVINSILNAIRRKKSKDTIVLASVIAGCVLFTLIYMAYK